MNKKVQAILRRALSRQKGDYRIYNELKREIESLSISDTEKNNAARELAAVLRV